MALRLHAFLALLLAALTVALLTPYRNIERASLQKQRVVVDEFTSDQTLVLALGEGNSQIGDRYLLLRSGTEGLEQVATLEIIDFVEKGAIAKPISNTSADSEELDYQDTDWVVHPRDYASAQADAKSTAPQRVAIGFGATCKGIGILIAMASIIGKCLLDSGAADRIVRFTLKIVGQARAPIAFVLSGFTVGNSCVFRHGVLSHDSPWQGDAVTNGQSLFALHSYDRGGRNNGPLIGATNPRPVVCCH